MLLAVYIGLGCAVHVRGRSRRSMRRRRRAIFLCRRSCCRLRWTRVWCLLVFTRNVPPCCRASGWSPRNSAMEYGHFEFLFTCRSQNTLVLGLVRQRLGDRVAKLRIFRCHLTREEGDDLALLIDHVLREIPGRQLSGLPEECVDRRLIRSCLRDHLLEHREGHVVGQLAERRD